jgi:hypothetical protein
MDARVDARVGDQRRNDAWPEVHDVERGIATCRVTGRWYICLSGRSPVGERLQHHVHDGRREGDPP